MNTLTKEEVDQAIETIKRLVDGQEKCQPDVLYFSIFEDLDNPPLKVYIKDEAGIELYHCDLTETLNEMTKEIVQRDNNDEIKALWNLSKGLETLSKQILCALQR